MPCPASTPLSVHHAPVQKALLTSNSNKLLGIAKTAWHDFQRPQIPGPTTSAERTVLLAGALASAGLKSITARHMAVCSQSLFALEVLLPHLRTQLLRGVAALPATAASSSFDTTTNVRLLHPCTECSSLHRMLPCCGSTSILHRMLNRAHNAAVRLDQLLRPARRCNQA